MMSYVLIARDVHVVDECADSALHIYAVGTLVFCMLFVAPRCDMCDDSVKCFLYTLNVYSYSRVHI